MSNKNLNESIGSKQSVKSSHHSSVSPEKPDAAEPLLDRNEGTLKLMMITFSAIIIIESV